MSDSTIRFVQQENIRLKEKTENLTEENQTLRRYLETIEALFWGGQEIARQESPLLALDELFQQVITVIGAEDGSLSRLEEETETLEFLLTYGNLSAQLPGYRLKSNEGIAGWVVENREPIIVNEPRQDWRFSPVVDEAFDFLTRSILTVPVLEETKLVGTIQLLNKRGSPFDEADTALVLVLGQVAAQVLTQREVSPLIVADSETRLLFE